MDKWEWVVLGSAVVLSSCGAGLHGLEDEAGYLVQVRATVEGDLETVARRPVEEMELRVGVLWAGVPEIDRFCIAYKTGQTTGLSDEVRAIADAGCRDPFMFTPTLMDKSVPLETNEDGEIVIPLSHLPSAEVLVGLPDARIAYGTVVIFDDRNSNGTLDIRELSPLGRWSDEPDNDRVFEPENDNGLSDVIYGASFVSLLEQQERIVYREGTFDVSSLFLPIQNCEEPPQGFSVLSTKSIFEDAPCSTSPLFETPLTVTYRDPDPIQGMACEAIKRNGSRRPNNDRPPQDGWLTACLSNVEMIAINPAISCPGLTHYHLAGCREDPQCDDPDWDYINSPPDWWPCADADPESEANETQREEDSAP